MHHVVALHAQPMHLGGRQQPAQADGAVARMGRDDLRRHRSSGGVFGIHGVNCPCSR